MSSGESPAITSHFADLPDPRIDRGKQHELLDIIVIALCAVICGAESWEQIAAYGTSKKAWLGTFLKLTGGIPSHDTFRRVFCRLDPQAFQHCFLSWIQALSTTAGLKRVAIDGKTLRRSARATAGKSALHLVSAWATENHLTLGQVAVDAKSNEITAIPELLKVLDLSGALVTIDAMGCQKDIARQIVEQGGDYVLAVKDNQPRLHEDVHQAFLEALEADFAGVEHSVHQTEETGHGRQETRTCYTISNPAGLRDIGLWAKLTTICMVLSQRLVNGVESCEVRYYIGSLRGTAQDYLEAVRGHWGIENSLHWVLDVCFREDESRHQSGHSAENFAWLRKLALCLLKNDKAQRGSINTKRLKAGWDNDYILSVLSSTDDHFGA